MTWVTLSLFEGIIAHLLYRFFPCHSVIFTRSLELIELTTIHQSNCTTVTSLMAHAGIATNNSKVVFDMSMSLDGFIRASNASGDEDARVRIALVKAPGGVLIGFSGPGEP
jgi:hypothetical protein